MELNTFGHAISAVLIYFIWWEKPFDVDYPTVFSSQILLDYRALLWMYDNRSAAAEAANREIKTHLRGEEVTRRLPNAINSPVQISTVSAPSLVGGRRTQVMFHA